MVNSSTWVKCARLPLDLARKALGHGVVSHRIAIPRSKLGAPGTNQSSMARQFGDDVYTFTRGRFVINESHEMFLRHVQFDAGALGEIAAEAVGSSCCIKLEKHEDGMCNKTFVLTMDDGQEIFAKIPNLTAGLPHLTTASEVATMDYVS